MDYNNNITKFLDHVFKGEKYILTPLLCSADKKSYRLLVILRPVFRYELITGEYFNCDIKELSNGSFNVTVKPRTLTLNK